MPNARGSGVRSASNTFGAGRNRSTMSMMMPPTMNATANTRGLSYSTDLT